MLTKKKYTEEELAKWEAKNHETPHYYDTKEGPVCACAKSCCRRGTACNCHGCACNRIVE